MITAKNPLETACRLVLLFHSGSPWDFQKQQAWQNGLIELGLDVGDPSHNHSGEATTRNLCNAVRAALSTLQEESK